MLGSKTCSVSIKHKNFMHYEKITWNKFWLNIQNLYSCLFENGDQNCCVTDP